MVGQPDPTVPPEDPGPEEPKPAAETFRRGRQNDTFLVPAAAQGFQSDPFGSQWTPSLTRTMPKSFALKRSPLSEHQRSKVAKLGLGLFSKKLSFSTATRSIIFFNWFGPVLTVHPGTQA